MLTDTITILNPPVPQTRSTLQELEEALAQVTDERAILDVLGYVRMLQACRTHSLPRPTPEEWLGYSKRKQKQVYRKALKGLPWLSPQV